MNLVIIGPSGSGKGTQAELLSNEFGIPTVSTGNLFRQAYKEKSLDGLEAAEKYWLKGRWVPTSLTLKFLGPVLDRSKKGFIIDGFPRLPDQPLALKEYLEKTGRKVDRVIHLAVSDKESIKRLLLRAREEESARPDETEDIIKKRLISYHQNNDPILDYYRQKGILEEIDGQRPIKVIFADILTRLEKAGLTKK